MPLTDWNLVRLKLWLRLAGATLLLATGLLLSVDAWALTAVTVYAALVIGEGAARSRVSLRVQAQLDRLLVLADIAGITSLVWATGSVTTLFVILYPLLVFASTLTFGRHEGYSVQLLTNLSYWVLLILNYTGALRYGFFTEDRAQLQVLLDQNTVWSVLPSWVLFVTSGVVVGSINFVSWLFTAHAISRQEHAEETLRESEARFRTLAKVAPVGIFQTDANGQCVYVNERWCEISGMKPMEALGSGWANALHPKDRERVFSEWIRSVAARRPFRLEYRFHRPDGRTTWVIGEAIETENETGRPGERVGTIADITDIKRTERLLAGVASAAQELLTSREVGRAIEDALATVGEAAEVDRVVYWARDPDTGSGRATYGFRYEWCREGVRALRADRSLVPIEEGEVEKMPWFVALKRGRTVTEREETDSDLMCHFLQAFGVRSVLLVPVPLADEGLAVIGFHSVSKRAWTEQEESLLNAVAASIAAGVSRKQAEEERLELERKLMENQKFESLGVLAGGVAHDFNNVLMSMLGNAYVARTTLPPDSDGAAALEKIEAACAYAGELVQQLLAYAGRARVVVRPTELNRIIEETARILRVSIPVTTTLEVRLGESLPPVLADATQLRQVMLNLLTNAVDAIGTKAGRIVVESGVLEADRVFLSGAILGADRSPGRYIYLKVCDSGCGMADETQRRIFDPFFTTKPAGHGLGLAAVLGIVRAHGGALLLESAPGEGTSFTVLFPRAEGIAVAPVRSVSEFMASRRGGTVLVIDDNPEVRNAVCRMLRELSFDVLEAADGITGIELFRAHQNEVLCTLMDVKMPGMDGVEAYRRISQLKPDVNVIFMSAFSAESDLGELPEQLGTGFLRKPFSVEVLSRALSNLLVREVN